jgi:uncharacterized protein (DUF1778 family)
MHATKDIDPFEDFSSIFLEMEIYYKRTETIRTGIDGEIMPTAVAPMRKQTDPKSRERIDVRLRPEQKAQIERAAQIKGLTVTDFIIQNAVANARLAIREYETWTLERPDAEVFAAALMQPPTLGPQLARAAQHYKERILEKMSQNKALEGKS